MPNSWDKIHYARIEKSVWVQFYIIESEESHYIKGDDIKVKTVSFLIVQVGDKNRFILQQ